MRIEWLAPLPPCRSGIADYTEEIAEELGHRAEIRYWNFWGSEGRGLSPRFEVVDWDPGTEWSAIQSDSVPVYHFGNNFRFHWPMWNLIGKRPGVAVIHDRVLLDLALGAFVKKLSDPAGFTHAMQRYYGAPGATAAREILEGTVDKIESGQKFPFIEYILERATAVIVHTPALRDFITAQFDIPVLYAPLPYNSKLLARTTLLPERQGFGDPLRIIVFGHLSSNRRLPSILQAMSRSIYRERLHLTIAGQISHNVAINSEIERLGLVRQVTLTGYVSEERLSQLLAASDVAINLRSPTMGEASHSQLKLWAYRLPTLVTRTGWYAEQPIETVVAVDPSAEIDGIVSFLGQAFETPQSLLDIGRNGRRWVTKTHPPIRYVRDLVQFVSAVDDSRDHSLLPTEAHSCRYER